MLCPLISAVNTVFGNQRPGVIVREWRMSGRVHATDFVDEKDQGAVRFLRPRVADETQ